MINYILLPFSAEPDELLSGQQYDIAIVMCWKARNSILSELWDGATTKCSTYLLLTDVLLTEGVCP